MERDRLLDTEGARLLESCYLPDYPEPNGYLCIDSPHDNWSEWLADNATTTEFRGAKRTSKDGEYAMCYWTSNEKSQDGIDINEEILEPWCKKCHERILIAKLKEEL